MVDYFESLGMNLDQIEELFAIYDSSVIHSIDFDNMKKIVKFLQENGFNFEKIRDIITIDLELFTYDYFDVVKNFEELKKQGTNYMDKIMDNPDILYDRSS